MLVILQLLPKPPIHSAQVHFTKAVSCWLIIMSDCVRQLLHSQLQMSAQSS